MQTWFHIDTKMMQNFVQKSHFVQKRETVAEKNLLFCGNPRWWRLQVEERACRKTRLGGFNYQFRTSAPPPLARYGYDQLSERNVIDCFIFVKSIK